MDNPYIESGFLKQARSEDHAVDLLRAESARRYSLKITYLLYYVFSRLSIAFSNIIKKSVAVQRPLRIFASEKIC